MNGLVAVLVAILPGIIGTAILLTRWRRGAVLTRRGVAAYSLFTASGVLVLSFGFAVPWPVSLVAWIVVAVVVYSRTTAWLIPPKQTGMVGPPS